MRQFLGLTGWPVWPDWATIYFGQFFLITKVAHILGQFFHGESYALIFPIHIPTWFELHFWAFFHQTHLVILPLCQASQIIFAKMFWASQQLCISSENRHLHMYYKIDYFVNSKIFYKDIRKITRCLHNIVNIITSVVGSLSTCIEMY
jgi:hypothetical protein